MPRTSSPLAFIAALVLAACAPVPTPATTVPPAPTTVLVVATTIGTTLRPTADYTPPPGALNPAVTQATISTTICVPGWTKTVRPPSTYTTRLKLAQMKARHLPGVPADYEEDHLVNLGLGGAPRDVANLWPEPIGQAHLKDDAEVRLQRAVCAGTITLAVARNEITNPAYWA